MLKTEIPKDFDSFFKDKEEPKKKKGKKKKKKNQESSEKEDSDKKSLDNTNSDFNNTMPMHNESLIRDNDSLNQSNFSKVEEKRKIKINNIYKFNDTFQIPYVTPCFYLSDKKKKYNSNIPISSNEFVELYNSYQITDDFCKFRPFDFFMFKDRNNYFYMDIKLINESNWIEKIRLNEEFSFLFENLILKSDKNNQSSMILFQESFIQNLNNDSIAILKSSIENMKVQGEDQKGALNTSLPWILVNKKKNKNPSKAGQKKDLDLIYEDEEYRGNREVVGLGQKKSKTSKNKKNKNYDNDDDLLERLKPKGNPRETHQFGKYLSAFGQQFMIDREESEK